MQFDNNVDFSSNLLQNGWYFVEALPSAELSVLFDAEDWLLQKGENQPSFEHWPSLIFNVVKNYN